MNIESKQVDISPLLRKAGLDCDHLEIIETTGMYPYKSVVEDNWAYFTTLALRELKSRLENEGIIPETIGIVGIGSGVEGIAAALIFNPSLRQLFISDIDREIIDGASMNLSGLTAPYGIQLVPLIGSFCEPMTAAQKSNAIDPIQLIHANIPNLPSSESRNLDSGAEKGTFLPPELYERYGPPAKYIQWALGAQWAYLQSAKEAIARGGSVLTELGGRVPLELLKDLFQDLDLEFSELLVGFKEQTEALIDFEGYHSFEKQFGVRFDFYLYQSGVSTLKEHGLEAPTSSVSGEEFKELLEPQRVSAKDAVTLYRQGIAVGHTVHVLRGRTRK